MMLKIAFVMRKPAHRGTDFSRGQIPLQMLSASI